MCSDSSSPPPFLPRKRKFPKATKKNPKQKTQAASPFRSPEGVHAAVTRCGFSGRMSVLPRCPACNSTARGTPRASADWAGLGGTCGPLLGGTGRSVTTDAVAAGGMAAAAPPALSFRTYEEYLESQLTALDMYYLEVSGRRDAVSVLPAGSRSPPVRAAGVGFPVPVCPWWGRFLCGPRAWALGGSSCSGRGLNFCRGRSLISS